MMQKFLKFAENILIPVPPYTHSFSTMDELRHYEQNLKASVPAQFWVYFERTWIRQYPYHHWTRVFYAWLHGIWWHLYTAAIWSNNDYALRNSVTFTQFIKQDYIGRLSNLPAKGRPSDSAICLLKGSVALPSTTSPLRSSKRLYCSNPMISPGAIVLSPVRCTITLVALYSHWGSPSRCGTFSSTRLQLRFSDYPHTPTSRRVWMCEREFAYERATHDLLRVVCGPVRHVALRVCWPNVETKLIYRRILMEANCLGLKLCCLQCSRHCDPTPLSPPKRYIQWLG